jgi:hypothetical protein
LTSKLPSMIYYCILCLTCFKSHLPSKSPILGSSTVPASPRHLHMEEELKPWSPEATPDTPGPGRGDFTDTNAENASGERRMHHNLWSFHTYIYIYNIYICKYIYIYRSNAFPI